MSIVTKFPDCTSKVWLRAGVSLYLTPEEEEKLLLDGDDAILIKALTEGRFQFDGDSFIPGPTVAEINKERGTDYPNEDINFDLLIPGIFHHEPASEEGDMAQLFARDRRAREVFIQLQDEDSMGTIADIIGALDVETLKAVLKLYVYAQ